MEENIYEKKSVHSLILYFSIPAIFPLIVEIMASVVIRRLQDIWERFRLLH